MSPWKAAHIGDHLNQIDTPALLLDLDAFERNLQRVTDALKGTDVRLRPHAKSHKCPDIAKRQIAHGAVGICCQKVSEAAVFVQAGLADVLVTNQVVGAQKLQHLAALALRARIGVLVDDATQVSALQQAAQSSGATIDVYIEVNVGANRCGVLPEQPCVVLAQHISQCTHLRFMGLQCYQGGAQHMRSPDERQRAIQAAANAAQRTRLAIQAVGISVERITGAGTGTFWLERDSGVYNEIQVGSYVFMDRDYADNQAGPDDLVFEHALFVLTQVMSRVDDSRAVVDAGLKASSVDSGMPTVWQRPDLRFLKASDEHGVIATADRTALALGDRLRLVPGHCDPTVNLYDELICMRADVVHDLWPIAARGALL